MTTPHADGPESDKAAWAGGDAADVAAAEAMDARSATADAVEGEVVNDGTAADDGVEQPPGEETTDPAATDATAELQKQLDERTADLQRVSAEFANYRRRVERDRQVIIDTRIIEAMRIVIQPPSLTLRMLAPRKEPSKTRNNPTRAIHCHRGQFQRKRVTWKYMIEVMVMVAVTAKP